MIRSNPALHCVRPSCHHEYSLEHQRINTLSLFQPLFCFVSLAEQESRESLLSLSPAFTPIHSTPRSLPPSSSVLNGLTEGCPGRWQQRSTVRLKLPGAHDGQTHFPASSKSRRSIRVICNVSQQNVIKHSSGLITEGCSRDDCSVNIMLFHYLFVFYIDSVR